MPGYIHALPCDYFADANRQRSPAKRGRGTDGDVAFTENPLTLAQFLQRFHIQEDGFTKILNCFVHGIAAGCGTQFIASRDELVVFRPYLEGEHDVFGFHMSHCPRLVSLRTAGVDSPLAELSIRDDLIMP